MQAEAAGEGSRVTANPNPKTDQPQLIGGADEELAAPRVVPRRPAGAGQAREDHRDVAVRLAGSS